MSVRLSSAPRGSDRLAARRRTRRRRAATALTILFVLLCGGLVYGLQQSAVRISNIVVYGADTLFTDRQESFFAIASSTMQGEYFGLIPRDSTFFFPGSRIRADIIGAHPDVAAVSIFRNGLTGISIKLNERAPVAKWCGLAPTPGADEYCYVFDASGFIFAAASSSMQIINSFTLYAPLVGDTEEPLRATISRAYELPAAFDFARELATFGSPVTRIVIRNDEVDDYLGSGTRVTYVLGNEENAFTALVSARDNLNLADGSLDYVDLRFDRKMYIKRK